MSGRYLNLKRRIATNLPLPICITSIYGMYEPNLLRLFLSPNTNYQDDTYSMPTHDSYEPIDNSSAYSRLPPTQNISKDH